MWFMWFFARFGIICTILKTWKTPWGSVTFSYFSPWMFFTLFKLHKSRKASDVNYLELKTFYNSNKEAGTGKCSYRTVLFFVSWCFIDLLALEKTAQSARAVIFCHRLYLFLKNRSMCQDIAVCSIKVNFSICDRQSWCFTDVFCKQSYYKNP